MWSRGRMKSMICSIASAFDAASDDMSPSRFSALFRALILTSGGTMAGMIPGHWSPDGSGAAGVRRAEQ